MGLFAGGGVKAAGKILWSAKAAASESPASIAARIAIAGDFLPAGRLSIGASANWSGLAAPLAPLFEDVAATFLNLECALDTHGLCARALNGLGDIVSAPESSLDYLAAIHARAVGIANNHAFDFGDSGVRRTREAITRRGFAPLGAGFTLQSPPEAFLWHGPGEIRVGFWAAAKATHDPAIRARPGVEPASLDRAFQAAEQLLARGARFRVALVHAGCLRTNRPDPEDVRLLDSIARAGFDIVAASHSHRISGGVQMDRAFAHPAFVFHGLGSVASGFIASPLEREGLVVVAGLDASGALAGIELRPAWINDSGFGEAPATGRAAEILQRFDALSAEIYDDSYERLFYQDVSAGLVSLHFRDVRSAYRQSGIRGLARKAARLRMRHVRRLVHKVVG